MLLRRQVIERMGVLLSNMVVARSAPAAQVGRTSSTLSVTSFGAIGDGRSHPIAEWIPSRYPDLPSLQRDYPDARTLADEIDFVAVNKAVRVAAERRLPLHLPAGTYLAWIYARADGVDLVGAGSDTCRIRLPDGARHAITAEDGRTVMKGTPCVIEVGRIGDGNRAAPLKGFRLSGVTLDGNDRGTDAPRDATQDVFGWGLAFTNVSDARYADIIARNCHAGGVGTFIDSRDHVGEALIEQCGRALAHPGFDVNSSSGGRWKVVVRACPYGVRLLDNCWNCTVEARIEDAGRAGLVCGNQPVNQAYANVVTAVIRGGCINAGAQIGDGWTRSTFDLRVEDIVGIGINSIGPTAGSRGERDNRFTVRTIRCGAQSAVIAGGHGQWVVRSSDDAQRSRRGEMFVVDVHGDANAIDVNIADAGRRRIRGLVLRPGAQGNRVRYRVLGDLLEPLNDQGRANLVRLST